MPGFPPIIGDNPSSLILGSMPSVTSLAKHQYYAHPRNAFWWIMGEMFNIDVNLDYNQRMSKLSEAGIAVWDVLQDCEREGSLDSNIVRQTEQPNAIGALLIEHPSIKLIAFNGGAAKQIFMRHCADALQLKRSPEWVQLPSTSPAHASITKHEKFAIWRTALL